MKRIVISWPGFTGYMGSCFKALSEQCQLMVLIEPSNYEQQFDAATMAGASFRRVDRPDVPTAVDEVRRFAPDLTLICGWRTPLAQALARAEFSGRKVLEFDMPWEWTFRKFVARWALWPRLRYFDATFVPGQRCACYARWLGFSGKRLSVGSNPSGWERFAAVRSSKHECGIEPRFLFAGRFSWEKGIDTLLAAYERYRAEIQAPWKLDIVGSGDAIPSHFPDGVTLLGFVPPAEMPNVMREHSCLVLPSRWEPWGVVAAEAMSSGLMTILSDRCGIVDDIRPTCVVRHDCVAELVDAMKRVSSMSKNECQIESQRVLAEAVRYSDANWAQRVLELTPKPTSRSSSVETNECAER